jgi:signal transduction histidine kinase
MPESVGVVLIDDNSEDRVLATRELLREFPDVRIDEILDQSAFDRVLQKGDFDLVLTDYQLHWTDGLHVLNTIKTKLPNIPVIMFTGTGTQEIAVEAIREGAADYVVKSPTNWPRLRLAVKNALDRVRHLHWLKETEKLALIGRLTSAVLHEIDIPLKAVRNELFALEHQPNHPEAGTIVRKVIKELEQIDEITRRTLGLYRESSSPVPLRPSQIMDDVFALYASRIDYQHIKIFRNYSDAQIVSFPGEMRQVFANLVANALDVMPRGGELEAMVAPFASDGNQLVRIRFCDTGPGIEEKYIDRIFDPFFSTKGENGTGLGLWLAREIVAKYGGTLKVGTSVRGGLQGTCFIIELPAKFEPKKNPTGERRPKGTQ